MSPKKPHQRLDEILVQAGLVSQEQIREALMRQKAQGGRFGSQLLYHRTIDEAGLVKALAIQFQCEGVVLSRLNIPPEVVKMLPAKVAKSRKAMPFDYDPDKNELKVACENPTDDDLISELNFVARGKNVKFYVAAELALNTAIARYYLGHDVSLDDNLLLEIPEDATNTGEIPIQEVVPDADGKMPAPAKKRFSSLPMRNSPGRCCGHCSNGMAFQSLSPIRRIRRSR